MADSAESSGSDTSWNDASGCLYVNNNHEVAANHSLEQTRESAGFALGWFTIGDEGGLLSSKPVGGTLRLKVECEEKMTVDETNRSVPECNNHDGAQWLFAGSGLVAPILFVSMVIVLGMLEPGYSHRTETMSILGGVGGLRGAAFNVGSALTGLLLIAFAIGLHREIGGGEGSKVGPILIVLGGVGMVGSAIFHCDLDCANVLQRPTFAGRMHIVTSFMVGSCLAISPFAMFSRLGKDQRWKNYRWFTLAMGILANIPGLILWTSFLTTRMPEWEGLIQRLGIVFPLFWVEVMAIHLLRLSLQGGVGKRGKEFFQGQL